jgi:ribose transport system substrate-binding protein
MSALTGSRRIRKLAGFASAGVVLAILISLMSCTSQPPRPQQKTVLFVCLSLANPFYGEMISGLEEAAAAIPNVRIEKRSGKSATDVKGQIEIIRTFLAQSHDAPLGGVVLVPADSGPPIASIVRELNDAKVPVINTDISIDADALSSAGAHVDAFIGSDNVAGGREAASVMATKLPHGGSILLLLGGLGEATTRDRRKGFLDRLEELKKQEHYSASVMERTADWSEAKAQVEVASLLSARTKIDGVFAHNDLMALGAVNAIESRSLKTLPVVIGYDATPEAREAIKAGRLAASISQNPKEMGKRSIEALAKLWGGGRIENPRQYTAVTAVTAEKQ